MADCIDLLECFGQQYRITFDEAYDPRGVPREKLDPWYAQIPCQRGVIYPHGDNLLAVEVDGRPITAKAVAALPGVRLHQDGSTEKTVLFPVGLFDQVAAIVKPRKRRRLTAEQQARLAASLTSAERAAARAKGLAAMRKDSARAFAQSVGAAAVDAAGPQNDPEAA